MKTLKIIFCCFEFSLQFFFVFKNAFLKIIKRTLFHYFRKSKTKNDLKIVKRTQSYLSAISNTIFTILMNLQSAKEIWEYLKKEYQDNERTKNMQVLNLIREFKMLRMKKSESFKEYSDKLFGIVNKVRLLGKNFSNERIMQKILVTLPKKYESKISSLEESKDLSSISLAELVNTLQAQKQRRMMRQENSIYGGCFSSKTIEIRRRQRKEEQ